MGRIKNNNKGLSLVFIDREETEGTMMLYIRNEKESLRRALWTGGSGFIRTVLL